MDDNEAYRRALRRVLGVVGYLVVGEAETGEEAIEMTRIRSPQIILMDVQMPGIGGIEAARRIAELRPEVAVLLMTVTVAGTLGAEITESGFECLRKDLIRRHTLRALIAAALAQGDDEQDGTAP